MSGRCCSTLISLGVLLASSTEAVGEFSTNDVQPEVIRFLVGELGTPTHHDSYVLPLSNPSHIAHARDLISRGPSAGATIAICRIAKGANGINRDYLAPGAPQWSWHVTELEGFADFAIEILDGWPTYVEGDVDGWIANTGGQIGFWQYSVVAELPTGDYDADLDVDADDFTAWRAGFGSTTDLSADGDGNGVVDAVDYVLWRKNLGRRITLPGQAAAAGAFNGVPEPGAFVIALVGASGLFLMRIRVREVASGCFGRVNGNEWCSTWFVRAGVGIGGARAGRGRVGDGVG